jgi:hypothetical protein
MLVPTSHNQQHPDLQATNRPYIENLPLPREKAKLASTDKVNEQPSKRETVVGVK